jgi:hypothetical protein
MISKGVRPGDVHSPKTKWNLIAVLDDGDEDGCAMAMGRWEGELVLALRWNGDEENSIGNPQSRGIPTWFIVPKKLNEALLTGGKLSADKLTLARGFFPAP